MAAWNMTIQMLLVVAFGALAAESLRSGIKKNDKILNLLDLELLDKEVDDDKMNPEEMEKISRKVDSMSDEELASVLYAVMPHERPKRTIGTFRRCLEKVRCLFRNIGQKRSRRNSPAAVIRTIR